ncbi:uncharacterized protein TM35_000102170 [Trypanosoma theileri]|uniref:Uncharacterized protein n=1 Tax=Trypanosoma theileri TaxID=67003 RepID=A0A1X0P0C9_9TRYP|nr:uncharacterized protein TM35_000102170 [Trypanosoma theileri]ORC89949.1 hypothetical protein TM35_000102170 [Trypanosoma theileri]
MAPKKQVKKQRVRVTNKALEARQFSTVRMPKTSEVQTSKVDVARMFEDRDAGSVATARVQSNNNTNDNSTTHNNNNNNGNAAHPSSQAFDPIPNDPMFVVVAKSKYWPPPTLEELHAETGAEITDGFDTYDRREDDKQSRQERTKIVRGELNHPRGKPRQNTLVKLDDDSDDAEEKE